MYCTILFGKHYKFGNINNKIKKYLKYIKIKLHNLPKHLDYRFNVRFNWLHNKLKRNYMQSLKNLTF